ncbi:TerB family tellurite resistance protein [Schlegelella sp. S2-27]|uniref:TerB family tellurite resistance protein n=1 Tax=Caldimonas mangrovi TaxID=2944811 RepID=A0ABT0YLL1_9BURK|nr:TerB family tellurite resistance protein [Caldimonas mangrovi]MCM5679617.1 TerB family tellurite resistance protein [Caldimonas mangrovi]
MLRTLKDLFDALKPAPPAETPAEQEHALQLATAVLLVEVMRSDPELSATEREAVMAALRRKFSLADDEIDRLVELAERAARDAYDYHAFTSRINAGYSMEQKIRIIEYMWQVAYADGHLSAHENHVMRKISDLLYIPHGAYVSAKMRAQQAGGSAT